MIKVGERMFKTKIRQLGEKEPDTFNLLQTQNSVVVEVIRGKNQLKFEQVSNYYNKTEENAEYFIDLLFSYKDNLLYTVSDENYWCPTCERMIRKYYDSSSNSEIKKIMTAYRETMSCQNSRLDKLIESNRPVLSLLPSGKYTVSIRQIFPTFGENNIFSDFEDNILTASTDNYYRFLGEERGHVSVNAMTSYMLPTQSKEAYSEDTLRAYRKKDYLGRGLVVKLSGFLGCLLDGHHKATVAYERNKPLECLVIEPYLNGIVYKGIKRQENELNFDKIPTIDEWCYLQNFIEDNNLSSVDNLEKLAKEVVKNKHFYEEMEQLIVALYVLKPDMLTDFYALILDNYLYKEIRLRYFRYLALLERTESIEKLFLDFLINDDYDNKALTKLCEDYFR